MKYIEAPNYEHLNSSYPSVFFAGSITGSKDWQKNLFERIKLCNGTVYNPRRENFDINNPNESAEQISWEYVHLHQSDVIIFYFSHETLAPITLFELGAALERNLYGEKPQQIFIYCEPEYRRKFDVEYQTEMILDTYVSLVRDRPKRNFVEYYSDYEEFVDKLIEFIVNKEQTIYMRIKSYNDVKCWVVSDLHLGHKKEFIWGKRGYSSVEEHDRGIIAKINKLVGPDDVLFSLGDFCLNTSAEQFDSYLSQITCQNIKLIWGNHPNPIYKMYRQMLAAEYQRDDIEVYPYRYRNVEMIGYHYECTIKGKYVVMNHFPIAVWENMKEGSYMLCGHSHYSYPSTRVECIDGLTLDCGWDGHATPLSFDDIIRIMKFKNIRKVDHHVKEL